MPLLRVVRPIDPVRVERGTAKFAHRDAAVPDVPGLVRRMPEAKFKDRLGQIFLGVTQQSEAGGVLRVEAKN